MISLTMSGTTFVLSIEPSADCDREVIAQLSPQLATVVHRSVSDASTLAAALEEHEWSAILCCKNGLKRDNTPYSFLDSLPGMACQIWLDRHGVLHFPYVSEGSLDLLGITPLELERQPQLWLNRLHPDDAAAFNQRMRQSAANATAWNWEGRIVLPSNQEIKWVNLRAKHHETNSQGTLWKGFMVNITHNKQAEIEIKQSRQRLRELSSHIETIKEEERTRIAREIHDEIGMLLTALKMDLSWVAQRLPSGDSALQEKMHGMNDLLDTAGKTANDLVHSLRPGFLDCFGIIAAIEIEANEFTKRTGIPCKITQSKDSFDISDEQSITLFRVFQETLNNIMKHAAAQQVQVKIDINKACTNLINGDKCIELVVSDDGQGFDESAPSKPRSFGLRGIQERIGQLGGKVTISSKPGAGTEIAVRLPMKSHDK
ncbi:MAG: histidine kinase [Gallionella sp.]|nr:histidine kinase [Gallionella sp.]